MLPPIIVSWGNASTHNSVSTAGVNAIVMMYIHWEGEILLTMFHGTRNCSWWMSWFGSVQNVTQSTMLSDFVS